MEFFSEAAAYESNSKEQVRFGLDLIEKVNLKKGNKVLDIGCGTGRLTEVLSSLVGSEGQVVAIDPDIERIQIAKEKHSVTNVQYIVGDADHLPGDGYDVLFSNFVLHWVKDKEAVFQKAQAILNPGGRIALCASYQNVDQNIPFPPGDIVSQEFKDDTWKHLYLINLKDIDSFATSCGFEKEYHHTEIAEFDCKTLEGVLNFYMMHSPGKITDISHFNLEKMRHFFKDNYVIQVPQVTVVYKKI